MKRPLLLALLLLPAPLAAQGEAPRPLSLAEALRVAGENNPAYRSARADIAVADARTRQSYGAFLPRLSASLGVDASRSRTFTGEDEFGNPLPSEQAVEFTQSRAAQSADLRMTLFDPAQFGQVGAARAEARATVSAVEAEGVRMRAEVARRYWEAVRTDRRIELEERLLASAAERLDATRRLLRIGARNPVDVLGAEVRVAEQEQALEEARGERRLARLALREAMGILDDEPLRLTTEPPTLFDPSGLDAETLLAYAGDASPRVERVESSLLAAHRRTGAARLSRLPTLGLSAGYGRSFSDRDLDAFDDIFGPRNRSLSFGLSVSLPVFDQFQTSAEIAQARATERKAEEEVRATRLLVEREVRGALIELENAFRAAQTVERAVGLSRERLEMAQEQYRLGSLSWTDLQDSVEGAATAERKLLDARFRFAAALATLEEKVGAPVRPASD